MPTAVAAPTVVTAPASRAANPPFIEHTPSAAVLPNVVAPAGGIAWRWPANGNLLEGFMAGDATKQGIDIAGNAGDPVLAAADGVVVYSGSGLVGYGELIIVKHSDEWLSAYGHNRKRLVAEGQRVRAGQPIAEMGRSGAPRDELHFEIRRSGRPVDPLQYLPAR
jgi:lipoprotein NlpD